MGGHTEEKAIALRSLQPELGLVLRHKENTGVQAGDLFCTRKCTQLETPAEDAWRLVMQTIQVGVGYPYLPDTEESELVMDAPAADGSIRCCMIGSFAVNSRF